MQSNWFKVKQISTNRFEPNKVRKIRESLPSKSGFEFNKYKTEISQQIRQVNQQTGHDIPRYSKGQGSQVRYFQRQWWKFSINKKNQCRSPHSTYSQFNQLTCSLIIPGFNSETFSVDFHSLIVKDHRGRSFRLSISASVEFQTSIF